MIITLAIYRPSYGPHGEPFSVRARFADRIDLSHYWTENDALDARDAAFDAGARSVHVAGLPLRMWPPSALLLACPYRPWTIDPTITASESPRSPYPSPVQQKSPLSAWISGDGTQLRFL